MLVIDKPAIFRAVSVAIFQQFDGQIGFSEICLDNCFLECRGGDVKCVVIILFIVAGSTQDQISFILDGR